MNGLRDMLYANPAGVGAYGGAGSNQATGVGQLGQATVETVGANLGFNVGHETFRVQLAIGGLLMAAFVVLLLLHRGGNRFSVKV